MTKVSMKTRDLTKLAIMSALVCIATYFLKVPTPTGYTHLGDSMIFIGVLVLGWKKGALAGGMGAALADFIGGYMQWVIPTFCIKFLMAALMGLIATKLLSKYKHGWIIGAVIGGTFQIPAYTLVKIPLFGLGYAISSLPTITGQTILGIVIASGLVSTMFASGAIKKLREFA